MQTKRTPEQVAWAAGLFEGEGCIVPRGKTSGELIVGMTDRDVLERFRDIVGVGGIKIEHRPDPHKDCYRWSVSNAPESRMVLELLLPWLSERRREAAEALLSRMEHCRGPNGLKTHCANGHEYSPENTYITPAGHRRCMTCHRDRVNAYNERKRCDGAGSQPVAKKIAVASELLREHAPHLLTEEASNAAR